MENDTYLKKKRLKLGLTQEELVKLCNDSRITQSRITEFENGVRKPTLDHALIIARALKLSGGELLKWINWKKKDWRSLPRKRKPKILP